MAVEELGLDPQVKPGITFTWFNCRSAQWMRSQGFTSKSSGVNFTWFNHVNVTVQQPGQESEEPGLDSHVSSGKNFTWFNCRSTWRIKSQGWTAKYPQVKP
jgi:hypothetical protein